MKFLIIPVGNNLVRAIDRSNPFSQDFSLSRDDAQHWSNINNIPCWRDGLILPEGNEESTFYLSNDEADKYWIDEIKKCPDIASLIEMIFDEKYRKPVHDAAYNQTINLIHNLLSKDQRKNYLTLKLSLPKISRINELHSLAEKSVIDYEKKYYPEESNIWNEVDRRTNDMRVQDLDLLLQYLERGMHFEEFNLKAIVKLKLLKNILLKDSDRLPKFCWTKDCVRQTILGKLACQRCGWNICEICGRCSPNCNWIFPPLLEDRLRKLGVI